MILAYPKEPWDIFKVENLINEYHAQMCRIFKGTEPADLATTWKFKIERIEKGISHTNTININVLYFKLDKRSRRSFHKHHYYTFPVKALEEPKKYVYLKLKKEFGKEMKIIYYKIAQVDKKLEEWNTSYKAFNDLEKEVLVETGLRVD